MTMLTGRKLRVISASPRATTSVFQDGTTVDPTATAGFQFDNAFVEGAVESGITNRSDYAALWIKNITSDPDNGRVLTFAFSSTRAWWYQQYPGIAFQPGDYVEFFCDAPAPRLTNGTLPAWHLNALWNGVGTAPQIRIFAGWIETFQSKSDGNVTVVCRDGMWRSNDVRLMRDITGPPPLEVPKIAFNVAIDSPDFFYCIKKQATTPGTTYGAGSPQHIDDYKMTVGEILTYLQDAYASKLQAIGVIPGVDIFNASDLTSLTSKPGPIVLEDVGFGEAVNLILNQWAPDMRVQITHKDLGAGEGPWRLIRTFAGFKASSTKIKNGTVSERVFILGAFRTRINVDTGQGVLFSITPATDGYWLRLMDAADPQRTELCNCLQVAGDIVTLEQDTGPAGTWETPDKVIPMLADLLPTMGISQDTEVVPGSIDMSVDLRDTYSAVNIVSVFQKTSQHRAEWNPTMGYSSPAGGLQPAWNTGNHGPWTEAHQHREFDAGVGGTGLPCYKTTVSGSSNIIYWFAFADSVFGTDHMTAEWNGSSVWIYSQANVNVKAGHTSFTILASVVVSDIGDGRPGMTLEVNSQALPVGFLTTLTAVGPAVADRFAVSSDFALPTTQQHNAMWEVGRKFFFSTGSLQAVDSAPHLQTCSYPQFRIIDGTGQNPIQLGLPPNLTSPPQATNPQQAWVPWVTGGLGAHLVWRRAAYLASPAVGRSSGPGGCGGGGGYRPPQSIEATWETTTTTIREARYPAVGFEGGLYHNYGISRVKNLTAKHWFNDDQDALYTDLAQRLWNAYQRINFRGSVALIGAVEFLAMLDLNLRVAYTTQSVPVGGGGIRQQFWGIVQSTTVDLENDVVDLTFDEDGGLRKLALEFFEDVTVNQASQNNAVAEAVAMLRQNLQCLAGARGQAGRTISCGASVAVGGTNASTRIKGLSKDNIVSGLGNSANAAQGAGGGGAGAGAAASTSHGLGATTSVFRDLEGNPFVTSPGEALYPGHPSGSYITPNPGSNQTPSTTQSQAQNSANGAAGMWGLTPLTTPIPVFSSIVASGTTGGATQFLVEHTGLPVNAFAGGQLNVLDQDPLQVRGGYTIISNTADTIVVAPISQAFPPLGTPCTIWRKPAPHPNAGEFAPGSIACTDRTGGYCVVELATGRVHAAILNVGANSLDLEPGGTVELRIGLEAGAGSVVTYEQNFDVGADEDSIAESEVLAYLGFF